MPAETTCVVPDQDENDVLRVAVESDLERFRSVYFMDQSPEFLITVENLSDTELDGNVNIRLIFDESSDKYERWKVIDCCLNPGEKREYTFTPDILSYQGNAAVGMDTIRIRKRDSKYDITTHGTGMDRLYTFMVYDREYYKLNYLRPRRAQWLAAALTVLVVLVGVIQILSTMNTI